MPRYGAVKAIMEEVGPKKDYEYADGLVMSESGSKLQKIRDTVGAIREKKYIKGLCKLFHKFHRLRFFSLKTRRRW